MSRTYNKNGKTKNSYRSWWEKLNERDHLERVRVDGKRILKQVLNTSVEECGLEISAARQGHFVGCCEHGNKLSSSPKCGHFLDKPRND